MKNKILALFASLSMSGFVFGDIQIGENVTIKGFLDASYSNVNSDAASTDSSDISLDEVEIDFLFNSGSVSARVDIDTNSGPLLTTGNGSFADDGMDIEQAHFTYSTDGGLSVTVGRFGSALGFEGQDPSGLYTYSRAYSANNGRFNIGNIDNVDHRSDGVRFGFSSDAYTVTVSVDQDVGQDLRTPDSRLNYEVAVNYTGMENLNLGLGYRNDRSGVASVADHNVINVHGAYEVGQALVAAEYTVLDSETSGTPDQDALLFLIDYDFSDKFGAAVRYSQEDTSATADQTKWTVAPNYQITDNLGTIVEFSNINPDGANNNTTEVAVELTYTF